MTLTAFLRGGMGGVHEEPGLLASVMDDTYFSVGAIVEGIAELGLLPLVGLTHMKADSFNRVCGWGCRFFWHRL
ncbi:hypothetical protein PAENIP36_05480 [Paenibacillus sp. P36]